MAHHRNWMKKLSPAFRTLDFTKPGHYNRVMIELSKRNTENSLYSIINTYQGKILRKINLIPILAVEIPLGAVKEIAQLKYVKKIWNDPQVKAQVGKAVQMPSGLEMYDLGYTGKDVTVAVLDTGIFPHPDLISPENRIVAWYDLLNQRPFSYDDNGHGTHIAGVIAGNGFSSNNKFRGIAPQAKLACVKVLDKDGRGNLADIISGIEWCIQNRSLYKIKIINIAVAMISQDYNDPLSRITEIACKKGIFICAAAGIDCSVGDTLPNSDHRLIRIGNRDDLYILSSDMNHFKPVNNKEGALNKYGKPDLLAPGTGIISLKPKGGYYPLSGASVSTAFITGLVAQLLEKQPYLKPHQINKILKKNAAILNPVPYIEGIEILNTEALFYHAKSKRNRHKKTTPDERRRDDHEKRARSVIVLRNSYSYMNNPYLLFLVFLLLVLSFS